MAGPTVILDLSPLARLTKPADWRTVERMVRDWRSQFGNGEIVLGIADNSLWYQLDEYGRTQLNAWKRRGMAQTVSWADPVILNLAEAHPGARVLTTDLFRDHRRQHAWLQGTDRVYGPVESGGAYTFRPLNLVPIPDHEVSMRAEEAELTPKRMNSAEGRELLTYEWACRNPTCIWGSSSVIGEDPVNDGGSACCPSCGSPAISRGKRDLTREVVVILGGDEPDRLPLASGMTVVFGRGRGEDRYDTRDILNGEQSPLVSRDHVSITNTNGRLTVQELGSKNGTDLVRSGRRSPLQPGVAQVLDLGDRIEIAGGVLSIRPSGRRRPRGRYEPDLSTAPWAHAEQPEGT